MTEQLGPPAPPEISPNNTRRRVMRWVLAIAIMVGLPVAGLFLVIRHGTEGGPLSRIERETQTNLKRALDANATSIALPDLLPFRWETVCVSGAYTSKSHIERQFGTTIHEVDKITWSGDSGVWTLFVLIDKNQLLPIRISRMALGDYVFGTEESIRCVPRDGSALTVTRNKDPHGYPVKFGLSGKQ